MKKTKFKVLSAMTVAAMVAGCLTTPAVAAIGGNRTIQADQQGYLIIHKYDMTAAQNAGVDFSEFASDGSMNPDAEADLKKYALPGVEFSYLKVSDFYQFSEDGETLVAFELDASLREILDLTESVSAYAEDNHYYYLMDQINEALLDALSDGYQGKDALEDYLMDAPGAVAMKLTNEDGVTLAGPLATGLYLVAETSVPQNVSSTCNPALLTVPVASASSGEWEYNVFLYPKNQTDEATVDKLVRTGDEVVYEDTTSFSGDDTLDYIVVSQLPSVTSKATYLSCYKFTDIISKGLKYDRNVKIYWYEHEEDAKQNDTDKAVGVWAEENYTVTYSGSASDANGTKMVVEATQAGLDDMNQYHSGQFMVVNYTAQVDPDTGIVLGDAGNNNSVTVTWSRTNDQESEEVTDETLVYSYGLDITKTFADGNGDFTKVTFVLKNIESNRYMTGTLKDGAFNVSGSVDKASEDESCKFAANEAGRILIRGLEAGDYELVESTTDEGYSLLKSPVMIHIEGNDMTIVPSQAGEDVQILENESASAKVDDKDAVMTADGDSEHAYVKLGILNSHSSILPQTGGNGLYAVTILGVIALGLGMYVGRKNRKTA